MAEVMVEVGSTSGYRVTGCTRLEPEPWYEYSVELQGTCGIAAQKKIAQANGRKRAAELKAGTFIAVQDRRASGREEHYVVGITVDCGDGECIVKHVLDREQIDGTRFDPGDYAIAVQWLIRLDEDPQHRTFEVDNDAPQYIINSTELRYANVELELVPPIGTPLRRSSRGMTRAQSSGGRVLCRQYVIPFETEQAILQECCA
jgi:hypothetical protein